jgi:hypothetical protein
MILVWAIIIAIPLIITDTSTPTMLIYWLMCTPAASILWLSINKPKSTESAVNWDEFFAPLSIRQLNYTFLAITFLLIVIADLQFIPLLQPFFEYFIALIKKIFPLINSYETATGLRSRWYHASADHMHVLKAQTAIAIASIIGLVVGLALAAKLFRFPTEFVSWRNVKTLRGGFGKIIAPFFFAGLIFVMLVGGRDLDHKPGRRDGCINNFICWSSDSLLIFEMAWLQILGLTILPTATVLSVKSIIS